MQKTLDQRSDAFLRRLALAAVVEATNFKEQELVCEILDIAQSPERSLWIRHREVEPAICLTFMRKTGQTAVVLEYATGDDGGFVEAGFTTVQDAAKAFEFVVRTLLDIRKQLYAII